jgi:hypothetical protein
MFYSKKILNNIKELTLCNSVDLEGLNATQTTYKNILWIKKIKTTCFFLNIDTVKYWIDSGYLAKFVIQVMRY